MIKNTLCKTLKELIRQNKILKRDHVFILGDRKCPIRLTS